MFKFNHCETMQNFHGKDYKITNYAEVVFRPDLLCTMEWDCYRILKYDEVTLQAHGYKCLKSLLYTDLYKNVDEDELLNRINYHKDNMPIAMYEVFYSQDEPKDLVFITISQSTNNIGIHSVQMYDMNDPVIEVERFDYSTEEDDD